MKVIVGIISDLLTPGQPSTHRGDARTSRSPPVCPTQLYLSSRKLAGVFEWFDFDPPNYGSLPAFKYEGEWYFSDGHTRAFAAGFAGADTLRIEEDHAVGEKYDFEGYRTCIRWCADSRVETVHDLCGRVIEPDTYETRWIDHCQAIGNDSDR